jgi:hypothetical protein
MSACLCPRREDSCQAGSGSIIGIQVGGYRLTCSPGFFYYIYHIIDLVPVVLSCCFKVMDLCMNPGFPSDLHQFFITWRTVGMSYFMNS